MQSEKEKAQLIIKTIKPLVEIDLFLGFDGALEKLLKDLFHSNEEILEIAVTSKTIRKHLVRGESSKNDIVVTTPLFTPNAQKRIGELRLRYSSSHSKELQYTIQRVTWLFAALFGFFYLLFHFYLKNTIAPLERIAKQLRTFDMERPIDFGYRKKDEIGLIVTALQEMQKRILEYKQRQENINKFLEEEVQKKTKELRQRLYIDSLTQLPNRLSLLESLERMEKGTLFLINVDDFKQINDIFGQKVGDEVLKELGSHLHRFSEKEGGGIFRLSGDEFALVFEDKMNEERIEYIARSIMKLTEDLRFHHGEIPLSLRVTIGISTTPKNALERADMALKRAKQQRKPFLIFKESLVTKKEFQENIKMVEVLKAAIENDRVIPYFQPIVDARTYKIKGFECLMRIEDEQGRILSPFFFLDVAKKSRYYTQLTHQMFQKSCLYFKERPYRFSLNLSIEDIMNEETVERISQIIDETGVANKVVLEIVESEGIENFDEVMLFIKRMRQKGALVAIDDFGSGYSNFEYLARLDVDYIKIDGSLIKEIDNENVRIVVETIVDYAKRRGLKTVAEFVSSKELAQLLRKMGIDFFQGYYFGEPKAKV